MTHHCPPDPAKVEAALEGIRVRMGKDEERIAILVGRLEDWHQARRAFHKAEARLEDAYRGFAAFRDGSLLTPPPPIKDE